MCHFDLSNFLDLRVILHQKWTQRIWSTNIPMCLGFGPEFPNKNKKQDDQKNGKVFKASHLDVVPHFLSSFLDMHHLSILSFHQVLYRHKLLPKRLKPLKSMWFYHFPQLFERYVLDVASLKVLLAVSQYIYIYISLSVYIPLLRGQFLSRVFFGGKICEKNINLSTCSLPEANSNSPLKNQWLVQINFLLVCSA